MNLTDSPNDDDYLKLENELNNLGYTFFEYPQILYKYTSVKRAIDILSNNRIMFSNCTKFNDPYEVNIKMLDIDMSMDLMREYLRDFIDIKESYNAAFGEQPGPTEEWLDEQVKRYSKDSYKRLVLRDFNRWRKTIPIFCSSKTNSNQLLWSHYADSNKGICIGLHPFYPDRPPGFITMNVKYIDTFFPIKITDLFFDQAKLISWFFTKSKYWAYEEEIRTICTGEEGLVEFQKDQVVEIFFGINTSSNDKRILQKIVAENNYNIRQTGQMRVKDNSFDFGIDFFNI